MTARPATFISAHFGFFWTSWYFAVTVVLSDLNKGRLCGSWLLKIWGNIWGCRVNCQRRTARVRIEQNGEDVACLWWTDHDKQSASFYPSTRRDKHKATLVRAMFIDLSSWLQYTQTTIGRVSPSYAVKWCRKKYLPYPIAYLKFIYILLLIQDKASWR